MDTNIGSTVAADETTITIDNTDERDTPTGDVTIAVRPEVARFALAMERELQANDFKGGWRGLSIGRLQEMLAEERRELDYALYVLINEGLNPEETTGLKSVVSEAADVANIAMFITDNLNLLMPTIEGEVVNN